MIAFVLNFALIAGLSCRHASPAVRQKPLRDVWVDGVVPASGNGTQEHPFKTLSEAMALGPIRAHVAVGTYPGPFNVTRDLEIVAVSGLPVFYVDHSSDPVFHVSNCRLILRSISVSGGVAGIESDRAKVLLEAVIVGGQRQMAIHVRGGQFEASNSTLEAAVSETKGLVLEENASAKLTQLVVRGPFRRGLEVRTGSRVEAEKPVFDQTVTAVHQVGGKVQMRGLTASGGRGPAIFVSRGELNLENSLVNGHEYALQAGQGAVLKVKTFTSQRAERAAFALVGATGNLTDLLAVDSGNFGGIQLVSSDLTIEHFVVRSPESYGVNARESKVVLRDGLITDVKDSGGESGDGLHFRKSRVEMHSVTVRGCAGTGLLAAEISLVSMDDLLMEHCKYAGIAADTQAKIEARSIVIRDCQGPAIAVPGPAEVRVDAIDSTHNQEGVVWAECQSSAQVLLSRVRSDVELPLSRCVHPWNLNAAH